MLPVDTLFKSDMVFFAFLREQIYDFKNFQSVVNTEILCL